MLYRLLYVLIFIISNESFSAYYHPYMYQNMNEYMVQSGYDAAAAITCAELVADPNNENGVLSQVGTMMHYANAIAGKETISNKKISDSLSSVFSYCKNHPDLLVMHALLSQMVGIPAKAGIMPNAGSGNVNFDYGSSGGSVPSASSHSYVTSSAIGYNNNNNPPASKTSFNSRRDISGRNTGATTDYSNRRYYDNSNSSPRARHHNYNNGAMKYYGDD